MNRLGAWVFAVGVLVSISSVMIGNTMQEELRTRHLGMLVQSMDISSLKFYTFAFGFPLGIGLSWLGVLIRSEADYRRNLIILFVVLITTSMPILAPALWGRGLSSVFFGGGGYLIMLLVLISIWYWGRYRALVSKAQRTAVDLQGMGYLCFAIAAWNICGVATMPSFALEPEMMLALQSQVFAIGQMKAVMVLFFLGWFFLLLGMMLIGRKHSNKDEVVERL